MFIWRTSRIVSQTFTENICGNVSLLMRAGLFQLLYWNAFECYVQTIREHLTARPICCATNAGNQQWNCSFRAIRKHRETCSALHSSDYTINFTVFDCFNNFFFSFRWKKQRPEKKIHDVLVRFAASKWVDRIGVKSEWRFVGDLLSFIHYWFEAKPVRGFRVLERIC